MNEPVDARAQGGIRPSNHPSLSADSNRRDPETVLVYQQLADLICVVWEFHKECIASGSYPATLCYGSGSDRVAFSAAEARNQSSGPIDVLFDFSDALRSSLILSTELALAHVGMGEVANGYQAFSAAKSATKLLGPGFVELADSVNRLGPKVSEELRVGDVSFGAVTAQSLISGGFGTGARICIHLRALLGESFDAHSALLISKISLANVAKVSGMLGLDFMDRYDGSDVTVFNGPTGLLDHNLLKAAGLGNAIGCPAALRPTQGTLDWLRQCGKPIEYRTVLEDFAGYVSALYKSTIDDWFLPMSDVQREDAVIPECRALLNGEVLRRAKSTPRLHE